MIRGITLASLLLLNGQYNPAGPVFPHAAVPCNASGAWAMNEGSGLTLNDTASGGTNTATINTGASVVWTANSIKTGVTSPVWNATGFGLATSTTTTNFDGTTPFSASAWINPSTTVETIMGNLATASSFKGWEVHIRSAGSQYSPELFIINSFSSNAIEVFSTPSFATGALHFIAITYDGSKTAAGVKIYVDGSPVATSVAFDSLTSSTASGLPLRFAARDNSTEKYSGAMGYAEVYPCVISAAFVSSSFASGPGIY